jgi:hypothetical protein
MRAHGFTLWARYFLTTFLSLALVEEISAQSETVIAATTETSNTIQEESSAQKVNDPTAYLRRADLDTDFNWIGYENFGYKLTPGYLTPLGETVRLRLATPFYVATPGDSQDVRLGDIFAGLTWIPYKTKHYSPFLGTRIEFPTGEAAKGAGLGVTQIVPAGGVVIYSFLKYGVLIAPIMQYRQTIFESDTRPKLSTFIIRPNIVFFLSRTAYARADWTVAVDTRTEGRTTSRLLLEVGNIFASQYKVSVGYEWDLWGAADSTETQSSVGRPIKVGIFKLNLSYLF